MGIFLVLNMDCSRELTKITAFASIPFLQEQGDLKLRVRTLESERAFKRVAVVQRTVGCVSLPCMLTLYSLLLFLSVNSMHLCVTGHLFKNMWMADFDTFKCWCSLTFWENTVVLHDWMSRMVHDNMPCYWCFLEIIHRLLYRIQFHFILTINLQSDLHSPISMTNRIIGL